MPASSDVQHELRLTLPAGVDLHARPAADFVRTALGFDAQVVVHVGDRQADAKSLMSVLALGAKAGTGIQLVAQGNDAATALDALGNCVAAFE